MKQEKMRDFILENYEPCLFRKLSSYRIKHVIEKEIGEYVREDEVKRLLISLGYLFDEESEYETNLEFYIVQRKLNNQNLTLELKSLKIRENLLPSFISLRDYIEDEIECDFNSIYSRLKIKYTKLDGNISLNKEITGLFYKMRVSIGFDWILYDDNDKDIQIEDKKKIYDFLEHNHKIILKKAEDFDWWGSDGFDIENTYQNFDLNITYSLFQVICFCGEKHDLKSLEILSCNKKRKSYPIAHINLSELLIEVQDIEEAEIDPEEFRKN